MELGDIADPMSTNVPEQVSISNNAYKWRAKRYGPSIAMGPISRIKRS